MKLRGKARIASSLVGEGATGAKFPELTNLVEEIFKVLYVRSMTTA